MDMPMVLTEARLFATPLAQRIAAEANKKQPDEVVAFAGTAASLVFQTTVVCILLNQFPPGSEEGEALIRTLYEQAQRDAIERWHKSDLKERFGGNQG